MEIIKAVFAGLGLVGISFLIFWGKVVYGPWEWDMLPTWLWISITLFLWVWGAALYLTREWWVEHNIS